MYSKKALLLIYVILGVSSYLGASPSKFDISSKRFYSTKRTRFFCRLTTILLTIQILFSGCCLYYFPTLTKNSKSLPSTSSQSLRHAKYIESKWCSFTTFEEFRAYPSQRILEAFLHFFLLARMLTAFIASTGAVLHGILPNNWISLIPRKYWNGPCCGLVI
ncbi:hypothetical protein Fcan01_24567 [Folsomia candida]|uniref:Uncharacterized protein n=1 Tax=Folsomia candida TaxID=158441 RepID=A0A226D5G5_FOLCA|nr:hypothetical protein Fcan01_24567 [Folsomia candida]